MSTPIPLTLEQCREAMIRLQQYALYMYHTPQGVETFRRNETAYNGRVFSISVEPDGRFAATLRDSGAKVVFDVVTTTAPCSSPGSIDNVVYNARVSNANDLTPEDAVFGREIQIFALSAFQRTLANQFLARMTKETIEVIAQDLSTATA